LLSVRKISSVNNGDVVDQPHSFESLFPYKVFSSVIRALVFAVGNSSLEKVGDVAEGRCHPSSGLNDRPSLKSAFPFVYSMAALKIRSHFKKPPKGRSSRHVNVKCFEQSHQLTLQSSGTLTDAWNLSSSTLFKFSGSSSSTVSIAPAHR